MSLKVKPYCSSGKLSASSWKIRRTMMELHMSHFKATLLGLCHAQSCMPWRSWSPLSRRFWAFLEVAKRRRCCPRGKFVCGFLLGNAASGSFIGKLQAHLRFYVPIVTGSHWDRLSQGRQKHGSPLECKSCRTQIQVPCSECNGKSHLHLPWAQGDHLLSSCRYYEYRRRIRMYWFIAYGCVSFDGTPCLVVFSRDIKRTPTVFGGSHEKQIWVCLPFRFLQKEKENHFHRSCYSEYVWGRLGLSWNLFGLIHQEMTQHAFSIFLGIISLWYDSCLHPRSDDRECRSHFHRDAARTLRTLPCLAARSWPCNRQPLNCNWPKASPPR